MMKALDWAETSGKFFECKDLWTLYFVHSLATKTETMNPVVNFAVAVLVDDDVVGHRWKLQ